jgi:hypothetical protein
MEVQSTPQKTRLPLWAYGASLGLVLFWVSFFLVISHFVDHYTSKTQRQFIKNGLSGTIDGVESSHNDLRIHLSNSATKYWIVADPIAELGGHFDKLYVLEGDSIFKRAGSDTITIIRNNSEKLRWHLRDPKTMTSIIQ